MQTVCGNQPGIHLCKLFAEHIHTDSIVYNLTRHKV